MAIIFCDGSDYFAEGAIVNEAKITVAVEQWRTSGYGLNLPDAEYTAEEQCEIFRRCLFYLEEIVKSTPRRLAVYRGKE